MSYPEPLPTSDAETLYKEAKFFYDEYERVKAEIEGLKKQLAFIDLARCSYCGASVDTERCRCGSDFILPQAEPTCEHGETGPHRPEADGKGHLGPLCPGPVKKEGG